MFKDSHSRTLDITVRFLQGDLASVESHWEMSETKWPDGNPWPGRKGLGTAILEKHDGKWLIVVFHNMDLPEPHTPNKSTDKP
jgi:ketosteroid isomerase-like protein